MPKPGQVFRWIARAASLGSLAFVIGFAVGSRETPTASEAVGLLFFPVGVAAGLALAWKWEAAGGLLSLASLAAFYGWSFALDGRMPGGPWFAIVAAPGVMFLLASGMEERPSGQAG